MDKIKELFTLIFYSQLFIHGAGRTMVKAPLWLVVIAGLFSLRLAALCAVLVVAFGLRAELIRG